MGAAPDVVAPDPHQSRGRSKPHVLIVEDEPQLLVLMQLELERAGFRTSVAGDGDAAVRRMRAEQPDVLLLDLILPVHDGWSVLADLQSWEVGPPVIVTSALGSPQDRQRALAMGAAAYLVKPFEMEGLLDLAHRLLEAPDARLPLLGMTDVWGDAAHGYFVRVADGPKEGVWQLSMAQGSWNFAEQRFDRPPLWIIRSPGGEQRSMMAAPIGGVRALEEWIAEQIGPEAASEFLAYSAPSQDRLGQIVPRRHLVV
jgi:CheY-like chemotaxis protein